MKRSVVWLTVSYAIAGIAVASAGAWYVHRSLGWQFDTVDITPRRLIAQPVIRQEKRKVYPYSIVPGGAKTVHEAKIAMRDPSVQDHYAAFDLDKLKQVTLTTDLVGYVSYKYGAKIYWTAKKIHIKAGETVYTDGTHVARGRCLNCYSAYPMMPTRPQEPSQKIMDTPVDAPLLAMEFPLLPLEEAHALPPPPEELTPSVPIFSNQPIKPGGGGFFPLVPIIPPIHRHHPSQPPVGTLVPPPGGGSPPGGGGSPPGTPPTGPTGTPPPVPPTVVTPEPQYLWILIGAFALLVLIQMKRVQRLKRDR
jgi:hypothetical protein